MDATQNHIMHVVSAGPQASALPSNHAAMHTTWYKVPGVRWDCTFSGVEAHTGDAGSQGRCRQQAGLHARCARSSCMARHHYVDERMQNGGGERQAQPGPTCSFHSVLLGHSFLLGGHCAARQQCMQSAAPCQQCHHPSVIGCLTSSAFSRKVAACSQKSIRW